MNSRQRILAALNRQPVDRIPFTPNLNGYAIRFFPERYHTLARWEIFKELGLDLFARFRIGVRIRPPMMLLPPPAGNLSLASSATRQWKQSLPATDKIVLKTDSVDGTDYITLETPVGSLRCGWRYPNEASDMPCPTEHLLKSPEDFDIYHFILDHTVVEPSYSEIEQAQEALGDEGVCEAAGGPTPMQDLIEIFLGVENFYYFMSDYPDKVKELMAHMMEVRRKEYEVLAASPAPIVITGENTSTTIASPAYIENFEMPDLNAYSDIVHKGDKLHVVHMCGRLHRAVDILARAHFDGIQDTAPPPTGDFDFEADRNKMLEAGKCICGGIDCTAFVDLSPEQMEEYVANRLAEVAPGLGFILGSGDTVPYGTTLENLRAAARAVEKYGQYPIQKPAMASAK